MAEDRRFATFEDGPYPRLVAEAKAEFDALCVVPASGIGPPRPPKVRKAILTWPQVRKALPPDCGRYKGATIPQLGAKTGIPVHQLRESLRWLLGQGKATRVRVMEHVGKSVLPRWQWHYYRTGRNL